MNTATLASKLESLGYEYSDGEYRKVFVHQTFYIHMDDSVKSYILYVYNYLAETEFARAYKTPSTLYSAIKRMGGLD